jgi:hypothetical protein
MRSALYYPHTHVQSAGLVQTALLLWDRLEYIVPWNDFRVSYDDRDVAEAMELIGAPHVPAKDEQREAHRRLDEILERPLPPPFYLRRGRRIQRDERDERESYTMYATKLLDVSWDRLRRAHIAGRLIDNSDYPLTHYAGLMVMSILADCCAGTTRSRVTDRGEAYATVAGLLGEDPAAPQVARADAQAQLVPISLSVIDASAIDFPALIRFRTHEAKESGHTLRDLRHRYLGKLDEYVEQLLTKGVTQADVREIKRQFADEMEHDFKELKTELRVAKTSLWTSKEIITTAVTGVGAASWLAGYQLPLKEVLTLGGTPISVGGLIRAGSDYLKERKALLQRHPMAYLYQAQRSSNRSLIRRIRGRSRNARLSMTARADGSPR